MGVGVGIVLYPSPAKALATVYNEEALYNNKHVCLTIDAAAGNELDTLCFPKNTLLKIQRCGLSAS